MKSCTAKGFITVPTCFLSPLTMRAPTIILPIFVDTFPTLHLNSVRAFATHCMHHSLFVLLLNGFFLSKKSLMDYHYDNTLSRTGTQSTHLAAQQHPPVSVGTPAVHTPKHTCFCWHPRRTGSLPHCLLCCSHAGCQPTDRQKQRHACKLCTRIILLREPHVTVVRRHLCVCVCV